ncbi:MAG: RNA degradosome polyphosphate kinase [Alphaproteobacteria bacterium]|nr:RNA degradosome polyphosphate kinase [Alphaproteobacteria bacterium]
MSSIPTTKPLLNLNDKDDTFFNRELSWLAFNERVLANSFDTTLPLGERLRFVSIAANNLDEFYMIRLAGLYQLRTRGFTTLPEQNISIDNLILQITKRAKQLETTQREQLSALLKECTKMGVSLIEETDLSHGDIKWLKNWYETNILPLLAPTTLDPSHPFPFIQNKGKCVFFELRTATGEIIKSVILIPENIQRFVKLPSEEIRIVCIETVIKIFINIIYPHHSIKSSGIFRLLRDSEIEIDDEADDLIRQFETALRARRRGNSVSLTVSDGLSSDAVKFFSQEMRLREDQITIASGHIGITDFSKFLSFLNSSLFFKPYDARFPQRIMDFKGNCFAAIHNKDIIIQHPYESFDVVLRFLQQAAVDPQVLTVRQTLYRTSADSPIVKALVTAAENGKNVSALIEIKARFDEENNIQLAGRLERAGVQVAYGLANMKIHAKLSLITRLEAEQLVSYAHFGTGNYHPVTAKIYADFSYFTCNPDLCRDAWHIFNYLTSHVKPHKFEKVIISPFFSENWLETHIDSEIKAAKAGKSAGIWIKANALVDKNIIEKLYDASQAGVKIRLIIRGICCLRPKVKGLSDNIEVTSIIGRFLEHSRVYVFANGGEFLSDKNIVVMASADLMPRNLHRRVEVFIPLENKTVRAQVLKQVMVALLQDTSNCWELQSDGQYKKRDEAGVGFSSHNYFMQNPSLSGLGSLAVIDK